MRPYDRTSIRGFTLVELMIVVAIVGVLAALSILGMKRYLASAKTVEAKNAIGAIARGAVSSYERETVVSQVVTEGASATAQNHALCGSATPVPAAVTTVKGFKYQPKSAQGSDFETGDTANGWKCLRFAITTPIYYMYSYTKGASTIATGTAAASAAGFEAGAIGDLDGDGAVAKFARTGEVNVATGTVRLSTQVWVQNEYE